MTLGERIQCILKERNLKQIEFANKLSISPNYVNLLVNNKKKVISNTLAKLIEESFGYSHEWILNGTGNKLTSDNLSNIKLETIEKIKHMSDEEVLAVLSFINTLDNLTTSTKNK